MSIDAYAIQKLAKLSRLELTPEQQRSFTTSLQQCLYHFDQLQQMQVAPPNQGEEHLGTLRPDEVAARDNAAEAIRTAGHSGLSLFKAPKVI